MSVLVVGGHEWGESPVGQVDLPTMAGLARRLGGRYEVIARGGGGRWESGAVGITYVRARFGAIGFLARAVRATSRAARTLPRPAVVMTSDVLGAVVGLVARTHELPLIVQVQGEVLRPGPEYGGRIKRSVMGLVMRTAVRRADAVRVVSSRLADETRRLRDARSVWTIGSRVDTRRFNPDVRGRAQPPSRPTIVCVASLWPVKNHDVVVKALPAVRATFPDVRLSLVGDGPRRDDIVRLAERLGVRNAVDLRGAVSHDEVARELASADVVVLPSLSEGNPRSVLEAQASGVPVIGSDIPALRAVIDDGTTGILVDPSSVDGWTEAIVTLLTDRHLSARLARAALDEVRREHGIEEGLDRYAELVRTAAGRGRGRGREDHDADL